MEGWELTPAGHRGRGKAQQAAGGVEGASHSSLGSVIGLDQMLVYLVKLGE